MPEFDPHDLAEREHESYRLVNTPSPGDTAIAVTNPDGTNIGSSAPVGGATAANQTLEIAALNEIATDTDHLDANLSTLATQTTLAEIATDTDNLSTIATNTTGSATSANQITEITRLTSILANQTNGTQVTSVNNFPVTQPVSGTVTANQGTSPWVVGQATGSNLHTVLDSGTLTSITNPVTVAQATAANLNATAVQASGANLHVNVDNFAATQPVSGTVTATQATGTNLHTVLDSGTLTSISNALPTGTNQIGHIIADTGSTTVVTGNVTVVQPTGTNLHAVLDSTSTTAVTQATASNLNAQVVGNIASGVAETGNPVGIGILAKTTNPTNVSDGQRVEILGDVRGKVITELGGPRELDTDSNITLTATTAETTLLTQVAATFLDIDQIIITNSSATGTSITIRDGTGGTVRMIIDIAANGGAVIPCKLRQATVNANWTAQSSVSVSSIHIFAHAQKNK